MAAKEDARRFAKKRLHKEWGLGSCLTRPAPVVKGHRVDDAHEHSC